MADLPHGRATAAHFGPHFVRLEQPQGIAALSRRSTGGKRRLCPRRHPDGLSGRDVKDVGRIRENVFPGQLETLAAGFHLDLASEGKEGDLPTGVLDFEFFALLHFMNRKIQVLPSRVFH